MKHPLRVLVISAVCSGCIGPFASDDDPFVPITAASLRAHVQVLAADSFMGRLNGSVHELMAAEYVRDRFVDYGIDPGAPEYLQFFNFVGTVPPRYPTCADSPIITPPVDPNRRSQNVVGVIPGAGNLADQWIIVGAHYDHVGCRDQTGGALVFNGADDNASGTAMVLEMARVFAATESDAPDNRRSLMFHAYGAEEVGLFGSVNFALDPSVPANRIVAMVNLDMVGRLRGNLSILGVVTASGWEALFNSSNSDQITIHYDNSLSGRSDHFPFMQSGIPTAFLHTGLHDDYHAPSDDYQLLDYDGMVTIAELLERALTILRVVDTPPVWTGIPGG